MTLDIGNSNSTHTARSPVSALLWVVLTISFLIFGALLFPLPPKPTGIYTAPLPADSSKAAPRDSVEFFDAEPLRADFSAPSNAVE
jgi:hypothetical protein